MSKILICAMVVSVCAVAVTLSSPKVVAGTQAAAVMGGCPCVKTLWRTCAMHAGCEGIGQYTDCLFGSSETHVCGLGGLEFCTETSTCAPKAWTQICSHR